MPLAWSRSLLVGHGWVLRFDIMMMLMRPPRIGAISPIGTMANSWLCRAVQAIRAFAVSTTLSTCLKALTIFLLAFGILARATLLFRGYFTLLWLLIFPEFSPFSSVGAIYTSTSVWIAGQPIFQTVAVTLCAVVFVTVALDFALSLWLTRGWEWAFLVALLGEADVFSHEEWDGWMVLGFMSWTSWVLKLSRGEAERNWTLKL